MKDGQDKYRLLLEKLQDAFAYHQIVTDNNGNAVDYTFLEVNQAFIEMTGLDKDRVIGSRVTDVLPGIIKSGFDWIGTYGTVALRKETVRFEQYSEPLERWYEVTAYSDEPGYFSTIFRDITAQKLEKNSLETLAELTEKYLQLPLGELDCQAITDDLLTLSGAKFTSLSIYSENGKKTITRAVSGMETGLRRAVELLGYELVGKEWPVSPGRVRKLEGGKLTRYDDLYAAAFGSIPGQPARLLQKMLGLGDVYVIAIEHRSRMIGDFVLIMPKGVKLQNPQIIEIYVRQVGLVLTRSRAEEALQEKEEKFSSILNHMTDVVWSLPWPPGEEAAFISPAAQEVFGYTAEEFRQDPALWQRIVHPDDRYKFKNIITFIEQNKAYTCEFRTIKPDGRIVWIHGHFYLVHNNHGKAIRLDGHMTDITERKQAEKKIADFNMELEQLYSHLDEELEKYRPLYEQTGSRLEEATNDPGHAVGCQELQAPDSDADPYAASAGFESTEHEQDRLNAITLAHITNGVILVDDKGTVQSTNQRFTKITGFPENDVKSAGIDSIFEGLDLAAIKKDERFAKDNFYKIQAWYQRSNGEYYYAVIVISAIKDGYSPQQQYLLAFQDITEEEKLKIEQDKLHQKLTRMSNLVSLNALLAGVIHDITQPVNAISIIAESIHYRLEHGMQVDQNKLIHDFENIYRQANNLGTVLNKVRSFELFSLSEAKLDLSLNEVVQNILSLLERQLLSQGVKVELKLTPSLPAVRAFQNSLEQIVLHLVTNAIQAFEQDDIKQKDRRLTILSYVQQKGTVTLEIKDNAGGIPEHILNQLFDPLITTKSSNKGMGLGLYIVHSLVSGLHGTIIAFNNKQQGATFHVDFPASEK